MCVSACRTKAEHVPVIERTGFDERVAGRGMLGTGCYFAENSSKSDQYCTPNSNDRFYIFLARVCLGSAYHTHSAHSDFRRPPELPHRAGRLHDSVLYEGAGLSVGKYREFVVYDRRACYPEYLIEYQRVSA